MNVVTLYLVAMCSQLPATMPLQVTESDTSKTDQWLLFDTLDLNLNDPCYNVAFYQDGIVFFKSGEENVYLTPMDRPDPESSQPLFTNKEIPCPPAAFSFTADYSKGYYTHLVKSGEESFVEKIYEMSIHDDVVSDIRQLPFTVDSSRNLHPAISSDGSFMIFSSDRLPTSGGLDLFVTQQTSTGWSKPQNLGGAINSSGHEWFPFLDSQNNLLFSSTGHSGNGGYDIYFCPFNGEKWGVAQNLGSTINGPQNELGISVHPGGKAALFSRTETLGPGGMAIMVTLNEEAIQLAGIEEAYAGEVSLVMQHMADPAVQTLPVHQPEPVAEPAIQKIENPEPAVSNSPDKLVFRVQIISSLNANSFPSVLIEGVSYNTYEYFYKGSYRITVGAFDSAKEANEFRALCFSSGFKQAFVAAFRGDQRETDPSVFKQ